MTTWFGRTLDGMYGLLIEEQVLRDLDRMCRDSGSVETGGILVGRYSEDLAVAIAREVTPPRRRLEIDGGVERGEWHPGC